MLRIDPQSVRVVVASVQAINRHEPSSLNVTALSLGKLPVSSIELHLLDPQAKVSPQLRAAASIATDLKQQLPLAHDRFLRTPAMEWTRHAIEPRAHWFPWWIRRPISSLFKPFVSAQ